MNPQRKITAWTYHRRQNGVHFLLSVSAESREEAIEAIERAGFAVVMPDEVRPTTLLPGHGWHEMAEEFDWQDAREA